MPLSAVLFRRMSATGGVILLSSSPPRVFARSPTAVDNTSSSPTLPSPEAIFASQRSQLSQNVRLAQQASCRRVDGSQRFRTTSTSREGVGDGFCSSATLLLKEMRTKENVPILKRLPSSKAGGRPAIVKQRDRGLSSARGDLSRREKDVDDANLEPGHSTVARNEPVDLSSTPRACPNRELSPLRLDKAPSRRLDWTPPTIRTSQGASKPPPPSFSGNLLGNFGYDAAVNGPRKIPVTSNYDEVFPIKRRKLDIVENVTAAQTNSMVALPLVPNTERSTKDTSTKRNKSPKKKYTTITGLATSHYFGDGRNEASSMMQYLSASQQRAQSDEVTDIPDTAKRKKTTKKMKAAKKAAPKPVLLSPDSAMKVFEGQDTLFGSASQLARDESPTLIRDTVQAIKQSEGTTLMSDPISTQITIPTSEPTETPKAYDKRGVSKFVKTRNLWSAAGRDEENALLQVDTVDMFDSPAIRLAFAGKDALLEPSAPRFRDSESPEKQIRGQEAGKKVINSGSKCNAVRPMINSWQRHDTSSVIDIDQLGLRTPRSLASHKAHHQARGLHTTAATKSSSNEVPNKASGAETGKAPKASAIPKPSFNGFTTDQLATRLKSYGFKPIKKREKMIEILNKCWEDQHNRENGQNVGNTDSLDKTIEMSHSDFLSKVHDISARPVPKVKNARGRPKKEGTAPAEKKTSRKSKSEKPVEASATGEKDTLPTTTKRGKSDAQPRSRKPKAAAATPTKPSPLKPTSKAKSRADKALVSEDNVLDIDDIEDDDGTSDIEDVHIDNTGVKTTVRTAKQRASSVPPSSDAFEPASWLREKCPPTRVEETGTALHPSSISTSITATATPLSDKTVTPPSTSSTSSQSNLTSQITLAITTFKTPPDHNSQQNPTFHQKILMYDPIILEDLAAWLNTEGFKQIGEDREVGPIEVRSWCEERGICCLWRGGWRGNSVKGVRGQGRGKEIGPGGHGDEDGSELD
jgi:Slx4 endonuclease